MSHCWSEIGEGGPARPHRVKQAEVEVKVERRSDFPHLSLSLNLPLTLADFFSNLLEERRRARGRLRAMEEMELSNRRHLFKESRVSDWCDIDHCAFDGVGRGAEP